MDIEAAISCADQTVEAMRRGSAFKDAKVDRWVDRTGPQAVVWLEVKPVSGDPFTFVWYDGLPISDAVRSENSRIAAAVTMGLTQIESIEQKWARFQARVDELETERARLLPENEALKARIAKLEDRLERRH